LVASPSHDSSLESGLLTRSPARSHSRWNHGSR
jgi:hypothetical protein